MAFTWSAQGTQGVYKTCYSTNWHQVLKAEPTMRQAVSIDIRSLLWAAHKAAAATAASSAILETGYIQGTQTARCILASAHCTSAHI
jgi:hypothetical protein